VNGLLIVAITVAVVFAATNGFHDSSNAIAALVATRVARPAQAVMLVAVFHLVGPIVLGTAVADTVGGIVRVRTPGDPRRGRCCGEQRGCLERPDLVARPSLQLQSCAGRWAWSEPRSSRRAGVR